MLSARNERGGTGSAVRSPVSLEKSQPMSHPVPPLKVLVTGGLGFVGSNLIHALAGAGGFDVTVLDNESGGTRSQLAGLPAGIVIGDIRDAALVDGLVGQVSAVVHLAGHTRVLESISDPMLSHDINVRGSLNILESMRRHGRNRIIFASTGGAIIGNAPPPLREDLPPRPISPYGASKLAVEGYLGAYGASYGLRPVSFRFANVFGPRSTHKGSVVAAFFKAYLTKERIPVYGDGNQTRDFVYVGDLIDVIIRSLGSDKTGIYQLGSGRETTINALLREMSEVVGDDLSALVDHKPANVGEVSRACCDISLAQRELGFHAATDLRSGLAATWSWFSSLAAPRLR